MVYRVKELVTFFDIFKMMIFEGGNTYFSKKLIKQIKTKKKAWVFLFKNIYEK